MMVLRPASPKVPGAGIENASYVEEQRRGRIADLNGLTLYLARNVPFVPRATSRMSPSTRAVKGVPDANERFPFSCQLPRIDAAIPLVNQCLFVPNGSS